MLGDPGIGCPAAAWSSRTRPGSQALQAGAYADVECSKVVEDWHADTSLQFAHGRRFGKAPEEV